MNFNELIGLEVCHAQELLLKQGITNFKFVYYVDRKQKEYDKSLVTAVRQTDEGLTLVVCRYKLET